jgi:polyphenol oxidase
MRVFWHLGNFVPDYRSIMREHKDFLIGNKLINAGRVVIAEQTHSDLVHICNDEDSGAGYGTHPQIQTADALITNVPLQYLMIRTADCFPVLLADNDAKAVGAVHSGREGTRKNIVGKAIAALNNAYGINPFDMVAYIGAGICTEHYQIEKHIWRDFVSSMREIGIYQEYTDEQHINIHSYIILQLLHAGVPAENITTQNICTYESAQHFSFRRDGTHNRQINLIGIEYE